MNYIVGGLIGLGVIYAIIKISQNSSNNNTQPQISTPLPIYLSNGGSNSNGGTNMPTIASSVDSSTINNLSPQDKKILANAGLTSNLLLNPQIISEANDFAYNNMAAKAQENTQQTNLISLGLASQSLLQGGISAPANSDTANVSFSPKSDGGYSATVNYQTSALRSMYDNAISTISDLTSKLSNTSNQLSDKQSQLDQVNSNYQQATSQLSQSNNNLNNLKTDDANIIEALKNQVNNLKNAGNATANILQGYNSGLANSARSNFQ